MSSVRVLLGTRKGAFKHAKNEPASLLFRLLGNFVVALGAATGGAKIRILEVSQ